MTFDDAVVALNRLNRLFIEPDGSFVWTGNTSEGQSWQVDGNLIDQGVTLAYVEISGCCPESEFNRLLSALGWPEAELMFHLPRRGLRLDGAEFRELAAGERGAV